MSSSKIVIISDAVNTAANGYYIFNSRANNYDGDNYCIAYNNNTGSWQIKLKSSKAFIYECFHMNDKTIPTSNWNVFQNRTWVRDTRIRFSVKESPMKPSSSSASLRSDYSALSNGKDRSPASVQKTSPKLTTDEVSDAIEIKGSYYHSEVNGIYTKHGDEYKKGKYVLQFRNDTNCWMISLGDKAFYKTENSSLNSWIRIAKSTLTRSQTLTKDRDVKAEYVRKSSTVNDNRYAVEMSSPESTVSTKNPVKPVTPSGSAVNRPPNSSAAILQTSSTSKRSDQRGLIEITGSDYSKQVNGQYIWDNAAKAFVRNNLGLRYDEQDSCWKIVNMTTNSLLYLTAKSGDRSIPPRKGWHFVNKQKLCEDSYMIATFTLIDDREEPDMVLSDPSLLVYQSAEPIRGSNPISTSPKVVTSPPVPIQQSVQPQQNMQSQSPKPVQLSSDNNQYYQYDQNNTMSTNQSLHGSSQSTSRVTLWRVMLSSISRIVVVPKSYPLERGIPKESLHIDIDHQAAKYFCDTITELEGEIATFRNAMKVTYKLRDLDTKGDISDFPNGEGMVTQFGNMNIMNWLIELHWLTKEDYKKGNKIFIWKKYVLVCLNYLTQLRPWWIR